MKWFRACGPVNIGGLLLIALFCGSDALSQPPGKSAAQQTQPPQASKLPANLAAVDLVKMPYLHRQFYLGAQRGSAWLQRVNRPDGRFLYGFDPGLRKASSRDNFIHQAAAAFTLARAAKFFNDERAAAVARQALLTLLLETEIDPQNSQIRRPVLITSSADPLAAAGWLVMAIHELPSPGKDLLQKADELCRFIRSQQRENGSFRCTPSLARQASINAPKFNLVATARDTSKPDAPARESLKPDAPAKAEQDNPAAIQHATGPALYALVCSYDHHKDAAKLEAIGKAVKYYRAWWQQHKNAEMIPWHSAACAQVYLLTKEQEYADFVFEMNDWLCTLQYKQPDSRQSAWFGGFQKWHEGQVLSVAPDVHSAKYMEALAQACRVARYKGDLKRFQTYQETLEACGQFVLQFQFSSANTQHFADWYREEISGAFHVSHENGAVRIDYITQAVCGLIRYLDDVAQIR